MNVGYLPVKIFFSLKRFICLSRNTCGGVSSEGRRTLFSVKNELKKETIIYHR
jgi:hypothetical protein